MEIESIEFNLKFRTAYCEKIAIGIENRNDGGAKKNRKYQTSLVLNISEIDVIWIKLKIHIKCNR